MAYQTDEKMNVVMDSADSKHKPRHRLIFYNFSNAK